MKREVVISYNWSKDNNNEPDNSEEIKVKHQEALEESAMNRIIEMMKEGYTSGELSDCVRMGEEDGEDGIEYSGYWGIDTKNTDE